MTKPLVTTDDLIAEIHKHRPAWPEALLRDKLNDAALTRDPIQLVIDAMHAAVDESVRGPGALPLHRFALGAVKCGKCEARERAQRAAQTSHPNDWCQCGTYLAGVENHECNPTKTIHTMAQAKQLLAGER